MNGRAIDRDTSLLIDKMQETEKEMERQRTMRLQSVDEIQDITALEESSAVEETPVPVAVSSVVTILKDQEAEDAIEGNYKEVEGMVTLILRIGEDERKVVIRMPYVRKRLSADCEEESFSGAAVFATCLWMSQWSRHVRWLFAESEVDSRGGCARRI